jgi:transcriptional regulator GlxA family with amidase domain
MLDVYGPLDALSFLARSYHVNLHIMSDTLDPVTTEPLTPSMNPFNSSFYPSIQPTHTFADAPDLDVLFVPGGLGSRSPHIQQHIDYIATTYPSLQYLITVCTGAILAAKSGVLDGKKATTNKNAFAAVKLTGPNTTWIPKARWVVDGNIWTSSGVSAGIDATLAWINHVYGTENATAIANWMEYQAHKDFTWDPFADIFNATEDGAVGTLQAMEVV